jgi:hypothetical protein
LGLDQVGAGGRGAKGLSLAFDLAGCQEFAFVGGIAEPVSGHRKFYPGSTMKLRKILFLIGSVLALSSPSVFSDEKSNDQGEFWAGSRGLCFKQSGDKI